MFSDLIIRENVMLYEEIVDRLCRLFIKLGIENNPVKIYETFIYMYTNGYLSYNSKFLEDVPSRYINLELNGYIKADIVGMMVMCGFGVCRHTSDFLYHIYSRLGYQCSQLFTYHPLLHIEVDNKSDKFLTNYEAQQYVDDATKDFDLFSKEERHYDRIYGKIVVHVNYVPETNMRLLNHTMNIVVDKDGIVHILDTRYHCVGEKIDKDILRMNYQGLMHKDFIQSDVFFHTYYGTDYTAGLELLNYNGNIDKDVLNSILYGNSCQKEDKAYEEFQKENMREYNRVADNIHRLIKRI